MAGMRLLGVGALLSAFDDLEDSYSGDAWIVGNPQNYAPHVEFGTYKMAAQPHLRPGIDATKAQMGRLAVQADDMDEFLKLTSLLLQSETQERTPVKTGALRAAWVARPE